MINWPESKSMSTMIRKIKSDPKKFIGSRFAPITPEYSHQVEYHELYGPRGMTQANNLDADPPQAKPQRVVKKVFTPGYFKEFQRINESDVLRLAALGENPYTNINAKQLVARALENLNGRLENRIEWMRWQALLTGQVTVDENDVKYTADYGIPAANLAKTVTTSWVTVASSTPIADIQAVAQDFIGTGFRLGSLVMNSVTAGLFCNSKDTKTFYSGAGIREKIMPGTLVQNSQYFFPNISMEIYDEGYEDDNGTFQMFVPDNKVVFLGDGAPGEIVDVVTVPSLHQNRNGITEPGKFAFIIEKWDDGNPHSDVFAGIYGLTRIRRPEAIMVMDVTETE